MAIKLSKSQIEKAEINYFGHNFSNRNNFLKFIFKLKKKILVTLINRKNYFLRIIKILKFKKKVFSGSINFNHINDIKLAKISKDYLNNNYCYLDNFINEEYYQNLLNGWPEKFFFNTADNPLKNYNFAFRYCSEKFVYPEDEVKNLKYFPVIENFYSLLENSSHFFGLVNKITNQSGYKFYSAACSVAKEGSFLVPHIDTVYDDNSTPKMLNIIYFVDGGNTPKESGGTGIYKDNNFNKPLFIPSSLKNTALIYNSKSDFFHGFDIISKRNFRKAITFQFKHDLSK